jgi:hypothetical protein
MTLFGTLKTYSAGLSCGRIISEYTQDDQCDMPLNLGPSVNRNHTIVQEYALYHTSRRHPDANAFQPLKERLCQTGS